MTGFTIVIVEPEDRHRRCWYARRTADLPEDLGSHTIVDGHLLYCAHPMYWPIVRYEFDIRNCDGCIEIPQLGMKHSLNISVAAGIVLWELVRTRI